MACDVQASTPKKEKRRLARSKATPGQLARLEAPLSVNRTFN